MTIKGIKKLVTKPHIFAKDYAKKRFSKDKLKEMVIRAIEIDIPFDKYYYFIYKVLENEGYLSRAEVVLRKAIEINPNSRYYCELSDLLYKKAQWWQVCDILEKAIELDSKINIKWYRNYMMALRNMKRFNEAIKVFEKIPYKKDLQEEDYFYYGIMLEEIGDIKKSQKAYDKAISISKNKQYKDFGVGLFYTQKWQWEKARNSYNKLIESTNNAELLYRCAFVTDRCYDWSKAEDYYTKAIEQNPLNDSWHYRLGFVQERQKKWEDAIDSYAFSASQREKKIPYRYYRLGYSLNKLGRYKESCEAFLLMRDDFVDKEDNRLLDEILKSQLEKKLTFAYSKVGIDTTDINAWYALAKVAQELDDLELSRDAYIELLARKEEFDLNIYFDYATILYKQENFQEASNLFIEQKIMQDAYGVLETEYNKNSAFKKIVNYTEYYKRYDIEDNMILYESYHGGSLSCSPYAIFQSIYKDSRFSNYRHIWVINDKSKIPKELKSDTNIIFIKRDCDLYMRYLTKAKYLINNTTFPEYFIKKEGQYYLNTWHGTPIKSLGKDIKDDFFAHKNASRNFLQASHLISPNRFTTNILTKNFDIKDIYSGIVAETGYPRQDLMLNNSSLELKAIKDSLGIKDDRPIVLYAPTWRGTLGGAKFDTDKLIADINLFKSLDINFIFRGHPILEKFLNDIDEIKDVVVSPLIDTNTLLSVVDVLITDYSSICFDYMALERPIIYYAYDRKEYESQRGLYFPLEDISEDIYKINSEVAKAIQKAISQKTISKKQQNAQNRFCSYDDGLATKRVIELFFFGNKEKTDIIENKDKKSILIYGGAFIPNGVTTSLLNLLNMIDTDKYSITLAIDPNIIKKDQKKLEQFNKLKYEIKVIGRFGMMLTTLEEKWIIDNFNIHKKFSSNEKLNIFNDTYRREFQRVFGMAKFDIVIDFEGYNNYWIRVLGSFSKSNKKVIYLHADMLREAQTRFPYLYGNFQSYKLYDKLISVSSDSYQINKEHLTKEYNFDSNKFDYCNNILNTDEIIKCSAEKIEDIDIFKKGKNFINIARLSPEKDHKKLIYAFSEVAKKNRDAKLIIIGDGPLKIELQQLIKKLSLKNRVLLLGQKFNPMPYLKASDCFVLSSSYEGQGLVLLEAMVLDKPVISTDIPGPRSILKDKYGLLVENSKEGLIQGMLDFLEGRYIENRKFDYKKYNQEAIDMFYSKVIGD